MIRRATRGAWRDATGPVQGGVEGARWPCAWLAESDSTDGEIAIDLGQMA